MIVSAGSILVLIQLIVRPCEKEILNIFDGFVLQKMTLVSLMSLTNLYNEHLFLSVTYIFIMLPLLTFVAMGLFINKHVIKKMFSYRKPRFSICNPDGNDYVAVEGDYIPPKNVIMLNM